MIRLLLPIAIAFIFTGCYTEKYDVKPNVSEKSAKLDSSKPVYISVPENGIFKNHLYHLSAKNTVLAIQSALATHINSIQEGSEYESYEVALSKAKENASTYLIYPTIIRWEDRATQWSGKPDKIEIKIAVIDVASANEISSVIIAGHSSWWTLGGDVPSDLLAKPINKYIDTLYK